MTEKQWGVLLLLIGVGVFMLMEYAVGYNTLGALIVIASIPAGIGILLAGALK